MQDPQIPLCSLVLTWFNNDTPVPLLKFNCVNQGLVLPQAFHEVHPSSTTNYDQCYMLIVIFHGCTQISKTETL